MEREEKKVNPEEEIQVNVRFPAGLKSLMDYYIYEKKMFAGPTDFMRTATRFYLNHLGEAEKYQEKELGL